MQPSSHLIIRPMTSDHCLDEWLSIVGKTKASSGYSAPSFGRLRVKAVCGRPGYCLSVYYYCSSTNRGCRHGMAWHGLVVSHKEYDLFTLQREYLALAQALCCRLRPSTVSRSLKATAKVRLADYPQNVQYGHFSRRAKISSGASGRLEGEPEPQTSA
ncbi:hypothetical protein BDW66DRAFT_27045 [Aspergillus desertorum]